MKRQTQELLNSKDIATSGGNIFPMEYQRHRHGYVLAIKDADSDGAASSYMWPILYDSLNGSGCWHINKEEIQKIYINSSTETPYVEDELILIWWGCPTNSIVTNDASHYAIPRNLEAINAKQLIYDVFNVSSCSTDDETQCGSVRFELQLDQLFDKYFRNKTPFFVMDNGVVTGPFRLKSHKRSNKQQHKLEYYNKELGIRSKRYIADFFFSPEPNQYTNNRERHFIFKDDIESFFSTKSDDELINWAKTTFKKSTESIFNNNDVNPDIVLKVVKNWANLSALPSKKSADLIEYSARLNRMVKSFEGYVKHAYELYKDLPSAIDILDEEHGLRAILASKNEELTCEVSQLEAKKQLNENIIESQSNQLHSLEGKVKRLQEDEKFLDQKIKAETEKLSEEKFMLERDITELSKQFAQTEENANQMLRNLMQTKIHMNVLHGRKPTSSSDSTPYVYSYAPDYSNATFSDYKALRAKLCEILDQQGRTCPSHFIDNLLIATSQNLFTLFVGLPGTGKTTMARLLCHCLSGSDRVAEISVGRGWTSHKELLGFHNPLSGNFVESHKGLYNKLQDLNHEFENNSYNNSPLMYVVLDEANLSPIEHYWSMFINDTDRGENSDFEIDLGNGGVLKHKNAIRFIGTINNDHTTEKISPRILDRVNVIYFRPDEPTEFLATVALPELNLPKQMLDSFFLVGRSDRDNISQLNAQKEIYREIKTHLRETMKIVLSQRIDRAMDRYCRVANRYMEECDRSLDYFVAQRVLPLINNGNKAALEELRRILEAKLNLATNITTDEDAFGGTVITNGNNSISIDIIDQIIKQSDGLYDMYDYFSIVGN